MRDFKREYFVLKHQTDKKIETLKKRVRFLENKPEMSKNFKQATLQEITIIVCENSEVSYNDVISKSRKREFVRARYICYKIAREVFKYTQKSIGEFYGQRDHSTIIHGLDTINDWLDMCYEPENKYYNDSINTIKAKYIDSTISKGDREFNVIHPPGEGKKIDCFV
jgi:chromosomal replication initiation ATPase DnaA